MACERCRQIRRLLVPSFLRKGGGHRSVAHNTKDIIDSLMQQIPEDQRHRFRITVSDPIADTTKV